MTTAPTRPDDTGRESMRTPRGRRGTIATIVALLVAVVCAAGAVEAISLAMHRTTFGFSVHRVTEFGRDTHLGGTVVLWIAIVAFALGALLVLVALIPPRRRLVELVEPDPAVAAGLTRRSLRRTLAAAATSVDGVHSARISGRQRLTVRAYTSFRNVTTMPDRIHERVTERLTELRPVKPPHVRVALRRKDD